MKARSPIVLLGAGGHARACIDVIEQTGDFEILGLVGTPAEVGGTVLGYPVLASDEQLESFLSPAVFGVVTVGQIKSAETRVRLYAAISKFGRSAPAIISPRAYVSRHASVGPGTVVLHGAVINAGAVVGANCIVNSLALIEHDVVVGDHCHVATGARVNSGVQIGARSFLGSNCTVRQGQKIGECCVIGMGVVVLADCSDGCWLPQARTA